MQFISKHLLVLTVLIGANVLVGNTQNIDSLLAIQNQADPQEKVFVHFDKNYYNPGETIWFKAYLFEGLNRSKDTKNFYAELRDEKGVLIDQKTAPVLFSGAASDFQIPDSFPKSTVFFRAYTTAMLNGDTSFLFVKPIRIINTSKKPGAKAVVVTADIKFLPEGGDLVAGLLSVVAFSTTGANEIPVNSRGIIKDGSGKQVATFSSLHDGMGAFEITPQAGQQYTAVWKDDKGKEYTTFLPKVKDHGIVLSLTNSNESKKYTLQRQADAADEFQTLTVVAILNQQLVYQARINLSAKASVTALLPTNDLPSGTLQVTVFDKNMKPVAERLAFVNNSNYEFDADAWISDLNIGKRNLNRGEVKVSDTLMANVSVAITDADLDVPGEDHDNIVTRMLLTGELRGKIHNPYYYFFSTSDSAAYHLDLVMLTHGWRRYNWGNVFAGKVSPPIFKESNYININGQVIGSQGGVFEPGLKLNGFMRTQDSSSNFLVLPLDRKGNVASDGLIFYDSAKLYLQFNDKNKAFEPSMLSIHNGLLEGNPAPAAGSSFQKLFPYEPDSLTAAGNLKTNAEALKIAAKKFKDAHMLQNVTVTAKAKTNIQKLDEKYASGMFSGDATGFDLVNDPLAMSNQSIFQYLQGKVAGLQINMGGGNPTLTWRGGSPVLYLNEMQSDASQVQSMNMSDVAYVKVFSPSSAGVIRSSGGGVISIYTKKGSDANSSVDSKLGVVKLNGYSAIKQFYSPDYASPATDVLYEDVRKTLYWNPFIILDKTKKRFKFQFFNNDITSRFRVVMEGINDEGKLVHVEKVMTK